MAKKETYKKIFLFLGIVIAISASALFSSHQAQAASQISLSVYVLNNDKTSLKNGEYDVRFAIYTADRQSMDPYPSNADAGNRVWEETQKTYISDGLMSIYLGSVNPLPAGLTFSSGDYYIGIRIGNDSEMAPRKKIVAVPNAINSEYLQGLSVGAGAGNIPQIGSSGTLDSAIIPKITKTGTITAGVWQGTAIADGYIANDLTGKTYNGLTLTSNADGFSIAGGAIARTLILTGAVALNQNLLTTSTPTFAGMTLASPLDIASGGTNASTLGAAGTIVYSDGTKYAFTEQGTSGKVLLSGGDGQPVWGSVTGGTMTADSLDFSELKDSMTLDNNLAIASSASNYSMNFDSNTLFVDTANNRVGIGTATPTQTLDVSGNAVISGSLEANSLIINGGATIGTLGLNIAMNSSLIPSTAGLNLGSSGSHWANIYVDNLSVGGTDASGTSSEYFSINTDALAEETTGLRFYRSALNGYAALVWNKDSLQFNLFKRENTSTLADLNVSGLAAASINGNIITTGTGTLTLGAGKILTVNNTLTFSGTDSSTLNISTGGTLGSNAYTSTAYAPLASPTFTTPTLGAATATSINKVTITAPATSATLTIADGKTLTASNTLTFTGTDSSSIAFGTGGTVAYTANKLSAFAATTSAELAGVISNETGTAGNLVFSTSPTLTSPTLTNPIIANISPSANFTLTQNSVVPFTSIGSGAIVNTLYLNAGQVGIGTTSLSSKLSVLATSGAQLSLLYDTSNYANFTVGVDSSLTIAPSQTSATTTIGVSDESVRIDSSGNVGIGTASPSSKLDITTNSLGVTQANTTGISLVNTTAAAAGAQQISPGLRWSGSGWKTDATAGSQSVDFRSYVMPVEGTANPTGYLTFESSINGVAYGNLMAIKSNGNVGIGTTALLYGLTVNKASPATDEIIFAVQNGGSNVFTVDKEGDYAYDGSASTPAADYAEHFYSKDTDLKSGEAVCVDANNENAVKRCENSGDNNVMGVVSTKPAIVGNNTEEVKNNPKNYPIVAMMGQIPGYVTNENGPIQIGDSLTSANKPGYMRKADAGESTVGIALQNFDKNDGTIQILISRRNKSLTVEKVEEAVTQNIADMNVKEKVDKMVSDAQTQLNENIKNNELKFTKYDLQITSLVSTVNSQQLLVDNLNALATTIQSQIDELKKRTNQDLNLAQLELNTANIESHTQDIALIKQILGITETTEGNVSILGTLTAEKVVVDGIETGAITIVVNDKDRKTTGDATITVDGTVDSDGNVSDGKSVIIKTSAVDDNSKIYLTPLKSTNNQVLYVGKIKAKESFEVKVDDAVKEDIKFNWWIVGVMIVP